jgi:hypothetical protein
MACMRISWTIYYLQSRKKRVPKRRDGLELTPLTPEHLEPPNIPKDICIELLQSIIREIQHFQKMQVIEQPLHQHAHPILGQIQHLQFGQMLETGGNEGLDLVLRQGEHLQVLQAEEIRIND